MRVLKKIIGPADAEEFLKRNFNNRPIKWKHVVFLRDQILAGRWVCTGDCIRFDVDGRLIDGQHRLHAIILAGVDVESFVAYDVPKDAFEVIDTNVVRTNADAMNIAGVENARRVVACLRTIDRYRKGRVHQPQEKFSNRVIREMLEADPGVAESVKIRIDGMPESISSACHYLFSEKNADQADSFFQQLHSRANLPAGHPILLLSTILVRNAGRRSKLPSADIMALTIKAWNTWRKRKTVRILKYEPNQEGFPIIE